MIAVAGTILSVIWSFVGTRVGLAVATGLVGAIVAGFVFAPSGPRKLTVAEVERNRLRQQIAAEVEARRVAERTIAERDAEMQSELIRIDTLNTELEHLREESRRTRNDDGIVLYANDPWLRKRKTGSHRASRR